MSEKKAKAIKFIYITWEDSDIEEDPELEAMLPDNLLKLLNWKNGFIQFGSGLHTRGICSSPEWHSLREVMKGSNALHRLYPAILETDIPFAQDCVADQYILRDRTVYRLYAETGELECLDIGLGRFYKEVEENHSYFLGLEPLYELYGQDMKLKPGEVIHVDPPVYQWKTEKERQLIPMPVNDTIAYLSDVASKYQSMTDAQRKTAGYRSNMALSQACNDGNPFQIAEAMGYEDEETTQ